MQLFKAHDSEYFEEWKAGSLCDVEQRLASDPQQVADRKQRFEEQRKKATAASARLGNPNITPPEALQEGGSARGNVYQVFVDLNGPLADISELTAKYRPYVELFERHEDTAGKAEKEKLLDKAAADASSRFGSTPVFIVIPAGPAQMCEDGTVYLVNTRCKMGVKLTISECYRLLPSLCHDAKEEWAVLHILLRGIAHKGAPDSAYVNDLAYYEGPHSDHAYSVNTATVADRVAYDHARRKFAAFRPDLLQWWGYACDLFAIVNSILLQLRVPALINFSRIDDQVACGVKNLKHSAAAPSFVDRTLPYSTKSKMLSGSIYANCPQLQSEELIDLSDKALGFATLIERAAQNQDLLFFKEMFGVHACIGVQTACNLLT